MSARALVRTAVAVAAAASIVLVGGVAAHADVPAVSEIAPVDVRGAIPYTPTPAGTLSAVDSQVGRGAALGTTPGALVPVAGAAGGSALVRVAALSASEDLRVIREGGAPVLDVVLGASASTTVLLPLHDGAVQLWASAPVDVRLDVLATFQGDAALPGSMVPIAEPALRADTATGLAAARIGTAEVPVGVVGAGGVPSEDVRAVYATLVVDAAAATRVTLAGQTLPVPAGRTTLTTVVAPDADGTVGVSASADIALQLYVTGWIPDEPEFASQLSLPGSFVPATAPAGGTVLLREGTAERIAPSSTADAAMTLAVVSAVAADERTLLDLGPAYEGRARGAVVDAARGAVPQLVLTPAHGDDVLTLRRGSATVTWAAVGDIVGDEIARPFDARPAIEIDSHDDGHDIDLGAHGYFDLSGTITAPGSSIDRVEISGPDGLIGTADVRADEDGIHWEFGAAAPHDGTFEFTATVYDRAGHSASDDVTLDVVAVDEDDVVTAPDVRVFNQDPSRQWLHAVDETEAILDVEPDFGPSTVLIGAVPSGVDESAMATPDGLLVRVTSIDRRGDVWHLGVEQAGLDEAFYQVDIDQAQQLDDGERMRAQDDPAAVPAPVDDAGQPIAYDEVHVEDGDGERAWVATGDEVDLEDLDDLPADPVAALAAPAAHVRAAAPTKTASASMSMQANLVAEWKSGEKTPSIRDVSKKAATPEEAQRILDNAFESASDLTTATITLAAKAQVGAEVALVFDAHFTWKWGFIPTGIIVDELTLKVMATVKGSLQLKAAVAAKVESTTWVPLGAFVLPTISFLAGPLPVVITNDVLTAFKGSYGAEAKVVFPEVSWKKVYTYGFTFSTANGYRTLSEEPKSSYKLGYFTGGSTTTVTASLNASVGPEITAEAKFYGAFGGDLVLSGGVNIEVTVGVEYTGHWSAFFEYKLALVVEMSGNAKVAIRSWLLGKAKLFTYTIEIPLISDRVSTDPPRTVAAPLAPPGTVPLRT